MATTSEERGNNPVSVRLDYEDVRKAARNHHGLTYKGFGVLSGNATSSLLMDYKAEHPDVYWRLVETLFGGDRPMMNTVKVEMGNDRNNSTGPNVATMRDWGEYPAVRREPGFQLAATTPICTSACCAGMRRHGCAPTTMSTAGTKTRYWPLGANTGSWSTPSTPM